MSFSDVVNVARYIIYFSDVVGLYINFLRIILVFIFVGDSNCGYRAVSLALFSMQEYHAYVRFMTALEIVEYARCYDAARIIWGMCTSL